MKKITILLLALAVLSSCAGKGQKAAETATEATSAVVEGTAPGNAAPAFTLKDIDGRLVALESLKGKITVLDFWGSWCIWCIRGIPEMKAAYEKYNGQLQIVGIACRDKDAEWRAAVAEHQLPWLQLWNDAGEGDITAQYAIEGYPTKIILDKELNVVEVFLGESPEFYAKIDELMAK